MSLLEFEPSTSLLGEPQLSHPRLGRSTSSPPAASCEAATSGRRSGQSIPESQRSASNESHDLFDKTELFITFRPLFIVGQSTWIGAHLSKLGATPYIGGRHFLEDEVEAGTSMTEITNRWSS